MDWRNANETDISFIKKNFIPKEIFEIIVAASIDLLLISLAVICTINFFDLFTVIIDLFLALIVYFISKSVFKSIKDIINFNSGNYEIVDCVISESIVNRIGLSNNSNVTLTTQNGKIYKTSYSHYFTTKAVKGDHALLADFGKTGKDFELILL